MNKPPLTPREKKVRRHNLATYAALSAFVGYFLGVYFPENMFAPYRIGFIFIMLAAIVVMFRTRNADEYTKAIWLSGTSVAFVATVAFMFFVPFLEGFFDGLIEGLSGRETERDLEVEKLVPSISLAAFFIASFWTRLRGTY